MKAGAREVGSDRRIAERRPVSGFAADRSVRQAGAGSQKQELPRKRRRNLPSQVFAADQRQAGKTVKISSSYKPANY